MRTLEQILKERAEAEKILISAQTKVDKLNAELVQLREAVNAAVAA